MNKFLIALVFIISVSATAEAVTSLETDYDKRSMFAQPIALEVMSTDFDLTLSGGLTSGEGQITLTKNGTLRQLIVGAPDLSVSTELSVTITSQDGATLFTSSNFAENATSSQLIAVDSSPLLAGTNTVHVFTTQAQDQAVNKTVSIIFFME